MKKSRLKKATPDKIYSNLHQNIVDLNIRSLKICYNNNDRLYTNCRRFYFHFRNNLFIQSIKPLRKKSPYSELFWFVFSPNPEKYGPE